MISPNKKGSFEDYLWAMGKEARNRGWRYVICVLGPVKPELKTWLLSSGCEMICLDSQQIQDVNYIITLLNKYKADILHTHFIGPTDTALLICKLKWHGKIVFTDHSSNSLIPEYEGNFLMKKLRRLKRYMFSQCISIYLPVSNFVAERIARNVPQAKHKIHRLYNAIDLQRFEPITSEEQAKIIKKKVLQEVDDRPIISFIGQIIVEKGIDLFLNVVKRIIDEGLECRFLIVGDGNYRDQVRDFCQQQDYKESVQYLGLRSDVNEIMRITDVFVMPSQWGEAFGLAAIEAAATGVAIIATNVGGLPEVVLDGHSGLLVELGDEKGLEASIRQMIENPEQRTEYGRNGRRHAESNFLLKDMVNQTFEHYQSIFTADGLHPKYNTH